MVPPPPSAYSKQYRPKTALADAVVDDAAAKTNSRQRQAKNLIGHPINARREHAFKSLA